MSTWAYWISALKCFKFFFFSFKKIYIYYLCQRLNKTVYFRIQSSLFTRTLVVTFKTLAFLTFFSAKDARAKLQKSTYNYHLFLLRGCEESYRDLFGLLIYGVERDIWSQQFGSSVVQLFKKKLLVFWVFSQICVLFSYAKPLAADIS